MSQHLGIAWWSLKTAIVLAAAVAGLFTACAVPRKAAQSGIQPSVTTATAPQLTYTTSWLGDTWGQGLLNLLRRNHRVRSSSSACAASCRSTGRSPRCVGPGHSASAAWVSLRGRILGWVFRWGVAATELSR